MRTEASQTRLALAIIAGICVLGSLAMVIYSWWVTRPTVEFLQRYNRLRLGMSESQVSEILGRTPDHSCTFCSHQIHYYVAPRHLMDVESRIKSALERLNRESFPATVSSVKELPDIYAAVQLAFDENDRLVAHTYIGEALEIVTIDGPVRGSHFVRLGDSFFVDPQPEHGEEPESAVAPHVP